MYLTAHIASIFQIVKRMVTLYVDDILAIETCGMSEDDMVSVIGQNITRHLIGRYRSGEVIGCRLNPGKRERCNMRNYAGTDRGGIYRGACAINMHFDIPTKRLYFQGKKVKPCPALCKVRDSATGCELTAEKVWPNNL